MFRRCLLLLCSFLPGITILAFPGNPGSRDSYELAGRVVTTEKKLFEDFPPSFVLESVHVPFLTKITSGSSGRFRFPNLEPGTYTLTVLIPLSRPVRRTIEISPSFASPGRRVTVEIPFERRPPTTPAFTVSVHDLTVTRKAQREYQKAVESLARRQSEEARRYLREAVRSAPKYSEAWNQLGTIAQQLGHTEEAEACFREALRWNAQSYDSLVSLSGVLLMRRKYEESLRVSLEAVAARPDDPQAQCHLGESYFQLGDLDKAEECLRKAKDLEPGHFTSPQLLLAQIYERRQDQMARARELEEFLRFHPDHPEANEARRALEDARTQGTPDDNIRQPSQ